MNKTTIALLVIAITSSFSLYSREEFGADRYAMLSGIRESKDILKFGEKKFDSDVYIYGKAPTKFLSNSYLFIPSRSKILNVAMGEGRDAVFLARNGYRVVGIDANPSYVKKAKFLAREFGVRFESIATSTVESFAAESASFDAIICINYIDRNINNKLDRWLRPGGILIIESFTDNQRGRKEFHGYNESYLLKPGELLTMFPGYKVLKFEEPLHLNKFTSGVILKKPEVNTLKGKNL
ncbi:MAG: class I SAM-dependent methyltransferase [Bacteriovoracaceae bacterium]|nr:class I SAM-dependent methyltransferase [Bacteriovoracaceae bacterium]